MAKNGRNKGFSTGLRTGILGVFCLCFILYPINLFAKEVPAQVEQSALKMLARDFVARIGNKLKTYDENQRSGENGGDSLSIIPEGELLLLRPKSEKFILDAEIGAMKHGGRIYYGLEDLIRALELPIDYDPAKKAGSGWFLREDWLIRFDFNKGEVVSRGETHAIKAADTHEDAGFIYISETAAKKWLAIETKPDIAQQYLNIKTPYPYPALARNARLRDTDGRTTRNTPVLPRFDAEEKMLDLNTLETQHSIRNRKTKDGKSVTTQQNVTAIEGDVLNHNGYVSTNWDNEQKLTSVRARLTKESEDADLLGKLKARAYTIGDTDLTNLPLTGGSSQELGVRVNNNPLRNADFQTTTIRGDALPGWDVELYREGGLVDRIRVDNDSRYEFDEIELYAGDNNFEVFFYGPQGELRREAFNLPVNDEFLATQNNTYDFSVSFNKAQTYTIAPDESEDANTPHLVARYNKIFGKTLTYAGVRAKQIQGEQKGYLGTGFTHTWDGFVFDGNAAMDQKGSSALEVGARKNIDDWRLSLRAHKSDEEYLTDGGGNNGILGVQGTVNRNFLGPFNSFLSMTAAGQYNELADKTKTTSGSLNMNHQMGNLSIGSTTSVIKTELGSEDSQDPPVQVNDSLTVRYNMGRVLTRAGVNYAVKPETKISDYFSQLTYQPTNRLSTDLQVEHFPETKLTQGRLSAHYKHDNFRLSPYIQMDNQSKMETGVRVSTTLVDQPGTILPLVTGTRVIGRGLVSSFVFLDKNGNSLFDGTDEPLPDVIVESANIRRRELTNEQGYSLLRDLPENYITDIRVDKSTLPDPFMIPGFAGVSVYPRPGQMIELNFPIHMAGEIDGYVYVNDITAGKYAARTAVELIPIDGKTTEVYETFTANDGYYVMDSIPPGHYLLNIKGGDAKRLKAGGMKPVSITIGYDGTTIYGQDLTLEKGRKQVPVSLKPMPKGQKRAPFFALETGKASKSKLSSLLEKMVSKKSNGTAAKLGLAPLTLEGTEGLKILPGKSWEEHFARCQSLNDALIPCEMVLFVPSKDDKPTKTADASQ